MQTGGKAGQFLINLGLCLYSKQFPFRNCFFYSGKKIFNPNIFSFTEQLVMQAAFNLQLMRNILYCLIFFSLLGCEQKRSCEKITFNQAILDSVRKKSDTNYTRRYRTEEFAVADYFINREDSTVCQIMKDTAEKIRQVIMAKNDRRFFTAEYYDNGQLKAKLSFDKNGKFEGLAEYYFENGCVMRSGSFVHGSFQGQWRTFDERGNLVSVDSYDENGQLINSSKK